MGSREVSRCHEDERGCAASRCQGSPIYVSSYRYVRAGGRPITVTRPLCARHARLFSMKYSQAWPGMMRRLRRPTSVGWAAMAAWRSRDRSASLWRQA